MHEGWYYFIIILTILIWITAGGYITSANVNLGSYKSEDSNLYIAYWTTFTASFVTWFFLGCAIFGIIIIGILIALGIAGLAVLFGSGAGEIGVAGAGVAGGAAELGSAAVGAEVIGAEVAGAEIGTEVAASEAVAVESAEGETLETKVGKKLKKKAEKKAKQPSQKKSKKGTKKKKTIDTSKLVLIFLIISMIFIATTGGLSLAAGLNIQESPNYDPTNKKLSESRDSCFISTYLCAGAFVVLVIFLILYGVDYNKSKHPHEEKEEKVKSTE
jgi:hypothetical protein